MMTCLECEKPVSPRAVGTVTNAIPFGYFCSDRCMRAWYEKRTERRRCAFCGGVVDVTRYDGHPVLFRHAAPQCSRFGATATVISFNDLVAVATIELAARPS